MEVLKALKKMKSFLAIALTMAMVFGSVPSVAFGSPSDNEAPEMEEATEGTVSEEVEGKTPTDAKADVEVAFGAKSAIGTLKAAIYAYGDISRATELGSNSVFVDSEKAYSFVVEPQEGCAFNADKPLTITGKYVSYKNDPVHGEDLPLPAGAITIGELTDSEKAYYFRGTKKVTITQSALAAVFDGIYVGEGADKPDDGILTLDFPNAADNAKWSISGFELKDVDEKASYDSAHKEVVCGQDNTLDLTTMLDFGSLALGDLTTQVLVYDEDGAPVLQSKELKITAGHATATISTDIDAESTEHWQIYGDDSGTRTKVWTQYQDDGKLIIAKEAIEYFFNNNMSVYIGVEKGGLGLVKIKTNEASTKIADFAESGTISPAPANGYWTAVISEEVTQCTDANKDKDFAFKVTRDTTKCTYIDSVTWTIGGKSDESYKAKVDPKATTVDEILIDNADLKKGDVEITVKGAYAVNKTEPTDTSYQIVDAKGNEIVQVECGTDLKFQIAPALGQTVNNISYKFGADGDLTSKSAETDGFFIIPNVKKDVYILPNMSPVSTGNAIVRTDGDYTESLNVLKVDSTNTAITKTGVATKIGEPILFTITDKAANKPQVIDSVSYTMGSAKDVVITPVEGKTYKIPAVNDNNVVIKVTYRAGAKVYAPANANVTVNFAENGKYIVAPQGSFTFTATPAKTGVTIANIYVNNTLNDFTGTALSTKNGGTVTLTTAGPYYVNIATEEAVSTTDFRADFYTTEDNIEKVYETGKPENPLYLREQTLKLRMGDAKLGITGRFYGVKDGKLRKEITGTTKITAPESTDILTLEKTTVEVAPKKVGNQDIVITLTGAQDSKGNSMVYPATLRVSVEPEYTDPEIYAVRDSGYTYDGVTADADGLDVIPLTLIGMDGQTGEPVVIDPTDSDTTVESVTWSFVPSTDQDYAEDYQHAFINGTNASVTYNDVTYAGTNGAPAKVNDALTGAPGWDGSHAWVCANTEDTVTVQAIVTYKDGTFQKVTKQLTFVDPLTTKYFMTSTLSGAVDYFSVLDTDSITDIGTLAVNVPSAKSVSVKYDVYSIKDPTFSSGDVLSPNDITKAIKDKKIEKFDDASFGTDAIIRNMSDSSGTTINKKDTTAYASLSGTYTITADKTNSGTKTQSIRFYAPTVKVDGVALPSLNMGEADLYFNIENEIDLNKVELITVDDQSKDEDKDLVNEAMALKTDYINNRDFTKVNELYGRTTKQIGYEFNSIGDGWDNFRLPTASDFANNPYKKKVLLGWALTKYTDKGPGKIVDGNGTTPADGVADFVYAPGAYVSVWGNVGFKAIWADKFIKYDSGIDGDSNSLIKLYNQKRSYVDKTSEKTVYPELVPGQLELGAQIPVVVGMYKVTGFKDGVVKVNPDGTFKAIDDTKLTGEEMLVNPGDFTITADGSAYAFNTSKFSEGTIAAGSTTVVGDSGKLIFSWTDPETVTTVYTGDVYKTDPSKQFTFKKNEDAEVVIGSDSSITITDDKTAKSYEYAVPIVVAGTLVDDASPVSGKTVKLVDLDTDEGAHSGEYWVRYNKYEYNWTSSDKTVATIKGGTEEDKDAAVITPVKAGNTTITLSVTKDGREIANDSFALTVDPSDVNFVFADMDGHTGITQATARAAGTIDDVFKVKVTDKSGKPVTVQYGFGAASAYDENKVINGIAQAGQTLSSGDANNFTDVVVNTRDFVGTDVLHVTATTTISDVKRTYQKDINIKTYYALTLHSGAATTTAITVDGVAQKDSDGKAVDVDIPLYEEDMTNVAETAWTKDEPTHKKNFNFKNVSLAGYSAVYDDGTSAQKEFSEWKVTSDGGDPNLKNTAYIGESTIAKLIGYEYAAGKPDVGPGKSKSNFVNGSIVLEPVMVTPMSVTGVPGTINMNYSKVEGENDKTVAFNVLPKTYGDTLDVKGKKKGFYTVDDGATITPTANKTKVVTDGKTSFEIHAYTGYDATDKTKWKAGTDVLGIYGNNATTPLAAITLNINGLNYDSSTGKVQYYENGVLVKNNYKTIAGSTYYFDANGDWIETTGISEINGKKVLIINGVVADKGPQSYDGNKYYIGENGEILTGWLTSTGAAATAANATYYADPSDGGKLVKGLKTIDGKEYVFGTDNRMSRASSTANLYEEVNGYYVNAAGEIAKGGIFKVNGVDRLFRDNYTIVSYGDPDVDANGQITLNGIGYTIEKGTHKATRNDVFYNPVVNWTVGYPSKVTKGTAAPTLTYTVTYTSANTGAKATTDPVSVLSTTDDNFSAGSTATEVTFKAVANLEGFFVDKEGTTPAPNVEKVQKYTFKDGGPEGISDIYYAPEVEWTTTFPAKWTKKTDYPAMTYNVTYTSKESGQKVTVSGNTAVVTSDPASIPDTATEATFIATADLSAYYTDATGTTTAQNVTFSQKYVFPNGQAEGYARDYKYKSHHFTWPTKTEPKATPNVKVKVTYSVTENKKTLPDETISGNAIMSDGTISGNYISFTAKVNTFDGLTKSETKKYNTKTGKLYEGQETPAEPEQPENKTSVNLFYTNVDKEIISLQLPDGADVKGGSGKWTTYYDIDESGTVTVKAPAKDLSKAASASNSVITIPVKSASGNEIGQFSYSLPVYYQKPKLKLSSTSGIVNTAKDGETTLVTTVTEKKSSGAFEKMSLDNLADDGLKYNAKSGSVVIAVGDEVGEITLTTSAKASGKISIQLENWVEPMELSYTVKATNKNVLTSDKKQVIFNLNSYDVTGADPDSQSIELFVNGEPAEAGALTLVAMPNGWDASGLKVADGCIDESSKQLTDSTLTFEYSGTKPANKSKTYSFQFKTSDNKKITVKAQMSKLALANKALTYKTQTKMNLSTGQRMVLIPQFKGVTGEYEDVKLASGDEKTFELEPDYERGQVYLAPADGVTLSSKTQYTPTIEATVGGVPVTTQLKFKPQQSNVTVKIDKVTVPKTKMEDGTMEAEANVLCTYKQGGKTFTTAPNRQGDTDAVTFMIDNKTKAPAVGGEELGKLGLTDGWYKIDKANVLVKYEASTGTILVRPTGKVVKPKNGSVKVWLNFNGKIVKKTLNVKIDKKK